mmetsp:Transcript_1693/g.3135  ORF Transcript_1693/g.3135 Transcript_1693/m.3135 type:complete len:103 (-) Transcript_1693:309-617(-)
MEQYSVQSNSLQQSRFQQKRSRSEANICRAPRGNQAKLLITKGVFKNGSVFKNANQLEWLKVGRTRRTGGPYPLLCHLMTQSQINLRPLSCSELEPEGRGRG